MNTLVKAADAAYPFDYHLLPDDVEVILGYVGGYRNTPHIWSVQEANAARASGRIWAAIWVPPQRALTKADGTAAAVGMIHALPQYAYPLTLPVFLDIEYRSYVSDRAGARAAVLEWQQGMQAAGYRNAIAYLPLEANTGWVAQWDDVDPTSLPVGWRGKQFHGAPAGGLFDLSEFNPDVFSSLLPGDEMTDQQLQQILKAIADEGAKTRDWINSHFAGPLQQIVDIRSTVVEFRPELLDLEDKARALVASGGPSVPALAKALAAELRWDVTATIHAPTVPTAAQTAS